jgi:hypothetical protein
MTAQELLEHKIDEAWEQYVIIHKAEIESGYDDAMDGFERKESEGYAMGLEAAYLIVYGKQYETKVPEFDPYDFEETVNG